MKEIISEELFSAIMGYKTTFDDYNTDQILNDSNCMSINDLAFKLKDWVKDQGNNGFNITSSNGYMMNAKGYATLISGNGCEYHEFEEKDEISAIICACQWLLENLDM